MEKTIVSVVMPCYNEQDNIEKSMRDILGQTFRNFELIVVDDCSTDQSADIIQRLAAEDTRVIYLRNNQNSGVAKTLNHGLSIAKGEYIARMDADDSCEPTRFEKQVKYLEQHPECILCGSYADVYDGKKTRVQGNICGSLKKHLVKNNPFVHSSIMFRRVINNIDVRYPETKGFEDYGLWTQLSSEGDFYVIPEILVHRVDINNLETKKTWEGFTKLKVYKKLRTYQLAAMKKTGHWVYGTYCISITTMKIIWTKIQNLLKGKK